MSSLHFVSKTLAFSPSKNNIQQSISNNIKRTIHNSRLNMSVKVTTYNVLSSHLGGADYFTSCKPQDLDPKYRLGKLKEKLDKEIKSRSIICLQEISTTWAGDLHTYFANNGYYMVTGLYGNKFNGLVL